MARCERCTVGEPCDFKHGLGGRTNHGCTCEVCRAAMRKANTESARRRRATPEGRARHFEASRRYHTKNRDAINERVRQQRRENPEAFRKREREYRLSNLDRARQAAREYRTANLDKSREWGRRYYQRNAPSLRRKMRERYWANWEYIRERESARPRGTSSGLRRYQDMERKRRDKLARIPAPRAFEVWTAAEDAVAMREELAIVEVCYLLGRSYNAVANRRNYLRKAVSS